MIIIFINVFLLFPFFQGGEIIYIKNKADIVSPYFTSVVLLSMVSMVFFLTAALQTFNLRDSPSYISNSQILARNSTLFVSNII